MRQTVSEHEAGTRLDVYLSKVYPERSRAAWQKLIEDRVVLVNGMLTKAGTRLARGDSVETLERATEAAGPHFE
ncbi:MAG TPA: S4 domain-containing protein, partial [Chloroflexota bacterium]